MNNRAIGLTAILVMSMCGLSSAGLAELPDLKPIQIEFAEGGPEAKVVRVAYINNSKVPSGLCVIRLTVVKLKGNIVKRTIEVGGSSLEPGMSAQALIDTTQILPLGVSLKDTAFKITVDATNVVKESNEANNVIHYKPK